MSNTLEYTPYEPHGRYLLEISYDGSNYHGWQIQPENSTVQGDIQEVLTRLYNGQEIHLIGSSRTDAGVHAIGFAATFLIPERPYLTTEKLRFALNNLLPPAIRIVTVTEVPLSMHSRYDALGKAYTYVINLGDETPFTHKHSWRPKRPLTIELLDNAIPHLTGKQDYSSFVVERSKIDDAVRTIFSITYKQFNDYLCITFIGDGFLYKMIRCLAGALEAVMAGDVSGDDIKRILEAKSRCKAPKTAPPHGLYLNKVFYDQTTMDNYQLKKPPFFG